MRVWWSWSCGWRCLGAGSSLTAHDWPPENTGRSYHRILMVRRGARVSGGVPLQPLLQMAVT